MNLWARRMGQLLLAALFLMGCEDENSLLGFRNPNKKFNVDYLDIPLTSGVLLIDSTRTDNLASGINRLLAGKYQDPDLGEVRATFFTQLRPGIIDTIPPESIYDSIIVEFQLDNYAYGAQGITDETISVHEITEDSISYTLPAIPYYYTSSLGYGQSMGQGTISVNYDSLKKQASLVRPDTAFSFRFKLNEETDFSTRLFDLLKNNPDNALKDPKKFRYAIKGLAVVAENPSNSILGFTGSAQSRTRLTLHYHTASDTLTRVFYMDIGSFSNITTDRIGELAGVQKYELIEPASELRYLQNGSPVITRIDLANFYTAMESIPNTLINAAEFVIESTDNPSYLGPPPNIYLRTIKEDNQFYNQKKVIDRDFMAGYWVMRDEDYYLSRSDITTGGQSVPVTLNYSDGMYVGNATLFMQDLYSKRNSDTKLQYLALYSTNIGKTVNRAVFNSDQIKLRIYYTIPSSQ